MQMLPLKNWTDEQLVIEFKQTRDNAIFGEIYNRYNKKVFKTCLGYTKNRTAAFDVAQDAMIKIMEKLPSLENGNLLGLWIHRVTCNFCADYYKNQKRLQFDAIEERYDIAAEDVDYEALAAQERLFDGIEGIMGELETETATILRLKYLEGHSIKELEDKLNLGASAVKMRLKRGRNQIIKLYNSRQRVAIF